MPYINQDGTIGGRKSFIRLVVDFFKGIIDFIALFFGAITNPPPRITNQATVSTLLRPGFLVSSCMKTTLSANVIHSGFSHPVFCAGIVCSTQQWTIILEWWGRTTLGGQQYQGCQTFRKRTGTNGGMRKVMPL